MVNEVNKLIFNALIDGYAIHIPNVGTLSIERVAAERVRGSRVASPSFRPLFTTECRGETLANVIMSATAISSDDADDISRRWLSKVTSDGKVIIDGVGVIDNGIFIPSNQLTKTLEFSSKQIDITKVKKGSRLPIFIGIILLLIGFGVGGYLYYIYSENLVTGEVAQTPAVVEPHNAVTEVDSEVVPPVEIVIDSLPKPATELQETAPMPKVSPDVESAQNINQVIEAKEVDAEDTEVDTVLDDWRLGDVRHYVIYGSYSTLHNANIAVRQITRKNPAAQCKVLTLGKMYAIAVYGSYNRSDCEAFKRSYRTLYKNSWIHTPKRFR